MVILSKLVCCWRRYITGSIGKKTAIGKRYSYKNRMPSNKRNNQARDKNPDLNPRLSALSLIVALLVCSVTASAQSTREFDRFVKLADEARLAERFDEAISLYGQALKVKPKWAEGWWYIGAIFYQRNIYPQARDAFQNLVALEPDRGPAWAMLGLCQFQTAEYEQAGISLQRARTLGVGDSSELAGVVRYHIALLYIHFEYFESAYDVLSEFVRLGHETPKVVEAFGLTMLRMPLLPKDIPSNQKEKILLAGRAGYNMAARRLDQARAAFDTLLSQYPN